MKRDLIDLDQPVRLLRFCKNCNVETERYVSGKCKPCTAKRDAKWYKNNSEKARAASAKWTKNNPEKKAASDAKWVKNNPEKMRAAGSKWHKNNPDKARARATKWHKNNPEKKADHGARRRARELNGNPAGTRLSPGYRAKLMAEQRSKCPVCGVSIRKASHLDHIVPLALGGPHIDSNMQLLCPKCNLQKKAKDPIDFMQSRGFLL